ncbi:MAG: protein kinase [Kofleriaceae bacterium]
MSEAPSEAFGPYLVYEQLGIGGMAQVHRAEVAGREGFHRPIALKRMLPHVAANDEMVKSFVREAHLASHLHHANVAQTYELGKVDDIYFIAMELITGRNLREILKQCGVTTGPMPVSVAMSIINQICDALDYAHNLCDDRGKHFGIIHRDVSPSNIIVAEGGVVKLIDFGIAKVQSAAMQTMSGTIKGKFGYMAPEYLNGRIDARADLFAVGVIAHELLTNRPLFSTGDDMETLQRVRHMEIAPPSRGNPQVPAEVDDIVMTALARDPDRRWQHATALRTAMTTVTHRLGLAISNAQTVEWVEWAFTQRRAVSGARSTIHLADDDPSIYVSHLPGAQSSVTNNVTLMMEGRVPDPPASTPVGTPAQMTAQPSIPELTPNSQSEYRAAVAVFERHEALPPTIGRMSDAVLPAIARTRTPDQVAVPRTSTPNVPHIGMTLAGAAPPPSSAAMRIPTIDPPSRSAPHDIPRAARESANPLNRMHDPPFVHSSPRVELPADTLPEVPRAKTGHAMTVVLVLLAAAIAAVAVYFLLPLVT